MQPWLADLSELDLSEPPAEVRRRRVRLIRRVIAWTVFLAVVWIGLHAPTPHLGG